MMVQATNTTKTTRELTSRFRKALKMELVENGEKDRERERFQVPVQISMKDSLFLFNFYIPSLSSLQKATRCQEAEAYALMNHRNTETSQ